MAGIYVHIPFCRQLCTYCDYYTVQLAHPPDPFVESLCAEISMRAPEYALREAVQTVYFGGGTPSVLSAGLVSRVLATIDGAFKVVPDAEITLEVNPDDHGGVYFADLIDAGVTRVLLGIQSFYDSDLALLGRKHTSAMAVAALEEASAAGFKSVGVDLLQAIPGQPPEYWAANLERLANAGIPHISAYELTVEPDTELRRRVERGEVKTLTEEDRADQLLFTMQYLEDRGYEQYEFAGFARPGHVSAHQRAYWSHENVLGFGPSAHSFWREKLPATGAYRWSNVRNLAQYQTLVAGGRAPVDSRHRLSFDRLAREHIMLRLRSADGIDVEQLDREYGIDLFSEKIDELAALESKGLIAPIRNGRIRLTRNGMLVCDAVTRRLTP